MPKVLVWFIPLLHLAASRRTNKRHHGTASTTRAA